jgi:dolichol kinase
LTMAAVFALVSLIFTAFGVAFAWSGAKLALDGQAVAGTIGISVGVFVFYGGYLFGRTAWRTRNASAGDPAVRDRQSRSLRFYLWYSLTIIAASLLLPMPGIARVALGVMVIGGTVIAMAAREDGVRRRK